MTLAARSTADIYSQEEIGAASFQGEDVYEVERIISERKVRKPRLLPFVLCTLTFRIVVAGVYYLECARLY